MFCVKRGRFNYCQSFKIILRQNQINSIFLRKFTKFMIMKLFSIILLVPIFISSLQILSAQDNNKQQWPGFRGPYACGIPDKINTSV